MNIVIAGGGFGGVKLALKLANKDGFKVRLISDKSYFEYHAALYRSATGRSPLEVVIPLADLFGFARNVDIVEDKVVSIDPEEKIIKGVSDCDYHYDKAVLALGNVTQYFNISGLEKYSYGIKGIQDALRLKRHLHEQITSTGHADHNYIVVGGGPSGVELAGELPAYIENILEKHHIKNRKFRVDLIEARERLLPNMPPAFSAKIENRLRKLGVNLYLDMAVRGETSSELKLPGEKLASQSVVWTAGVANNPFFGDNKKHFTQGRIGRAKVDKHLQARPDVYCIGDCADTPLSGMAQTAIHDADFLAGNLIRHSKGQPLEEYQPSRPIYAVPVGPKWSAILWGRVRLYGYAGWIIRRLADLRLYLKFLSVRRALSAWRWGMKAEEAYPALAKNRQK